ncbi:LysR family transcriptional regulator [Brevibacterium siliguriense]|uniref:LysR family transcriptional regulator n=1 Tax=Brevibacterium siliguriense TaxID=1136497 RepID=UPI001428D094|nr:LysR family transcriptional regulator [Brevibacterium siliguriense]
MRIDDFHFFATIGEEMNLTAAARSMGMSVSAVSRRLTDLENRLGVRLIHRTSRQMVMTAEGLLFLEGSRRIVHEAEVLRADVANSVDSERGTLVICGTLGFGRTHLSELVADFHRAHPNIEVHLELSADPFDLENSRFDMLVGVGAAKDSQLVYRRLLRNRRVLCASPDYLERRGAPHSIHELRDHDCLILSEHEPDFNLWKFELDGVITPIRVRGPLRCNDGDTVTRWAVQGHGIAMRSVWNVRPYLETGQLVPVLADVPTIRSDIYLAFPNTELYPLRAQRFTEFLQREIPKRVKSPDDFFGFS